jgi:hypothetical protein
MIKLHEAILELMPTAEVTVRNESEIIWGANCLNNHPTEEQIKTKQAELQAEYDALAYSRNREAEYPSIQECVHAILDDDLTALQEKRQAVKTKYPKS